MIRRSFLLVAAAAVLALGAACTDDEPEVTDTPTATATETATATGTESPTATATETATETATTAPTETATATATETPSGDACADLAPEAAEAAFTFVTTLQSGDVLSTGATVEGCSRTFESNVPYRLVDREGNVLVEAATMGGGVDGAAPFEFTVEYTVTEAQIGHLFVGGEDPSDGEGFPPVTNQIPVVLLPSGS